MKQIFTVTLETWPGDSLVTEAELRHVLIGYFGTNVKEVKEQENK
jgi:hypothetical protein